MNRREYEKYLSEAYGVTGENPWRDSPTNTVFRHFDNKKWFALVMDIDKKHIGKGSGLVSVVNLKCDPLTISSLLGGNGVHPAYHMNKEHWITVELNEKTDEDLLFFLTAQSFDLTSLKIKNRHFDNLPLT